MRIQVVEDCAILLLCTLFTAKYNQSALGTHITRNDVLVVLERCKQKHPEIAVKAVSEFNWVKLLFRELAATRVSKI